jgi:hypothetical protein
MLGLMNIFTLILMVLGFVLLFGPAGRWRCGLKKSRDHGLACWLLAEIIRTTGH